MKSTTPSTTTPAVSLETELKLSLAKLSNEALNKRINDAAATRNKSAAKIRHVEQALMDLSAARGSLELLAEIDPSAAAKQAAALDAQEADLTKQRREAEASFRSVASLQPLIEAEIKFREDGVFKAQRELLRRRFPCTVHEGSPGDPRVSYTAEFAALREQLIAFSAGEGLRQSAFNADAYDLKAILGLCTATAQQRLDSAADEAKKEAIVAVEKARMGK